MSAARPYTTIRLVGLLLCVAALGGCAMSRDPPDPFERFNRGVYQFNEGFDKIVLEPTAKTYRRILPAFARTGVRNFFANLNDIPVALNNLAQGKIEPAASDLSRVIINSSIGLLGLFDVASEAGIEKHQEDFGQTLGWWGLADGPFLMLPFFGPSTSRDLAGFVVDWTTDPVSYVDPSGARYALRGTRIVNRRAELIEASDVLRTALDPYQFLRDAYLQRRRNLVYDGNPPSERDGAGPPPKPAVPPAKPRPARKWMQ